MKLLTGTRYPWSVEVIDEDLVVRGQKATWFGGADDPMDDGRTASGISTIANTAFLGCALPMDLGRKKNNPCAGSPFPRLPWFTAVVVTNLATGKTLTVKLIDLGPSAPPRATAAIDLTQAAFRALGGKLKDGIMRVDFRVPGGSKLITRRVA